MEGLSEKHYSIDAGIGEKMNGCPYSLYEDGHDVEDYIIPPKGYVFTGFSFEPLPNNQIYDGRLVAQYEKEPLKERMTSVLRVLVWILIIGAVIGLITVLTIGIFNPKQTKHQPQPSTEAPLVVVDTLPEDTVTIIEEQIPNAIETSAPEVEIQQPAVVDDNALFEEEFWALIHRRAIQMDDYDGLYKKYKGKVSGEAYDYLRFTILKDASSYIEWSKKLRKIPNDEIGAIESITTLKSRIKEIQ